MDLPHTGASAHCHTIDDSCHTARGIVYRKERRRRGRRVRREVPMKIDTVVRIGLIGMGVAWVVEGGGAFGQSINIDFGTPGTVPDHTYAAAARAGAWNSFETLPTNQRFPLVNLYGQPIGARLFNNGGTDMLS